MIDFKQSFGTRFVQGSVIRIDQESKTVIIDNGDSVDYTDVVIAVGGVASFPGQSQNKSTQAATAQYEELGGEIDKASNIIIIGGGAVGVEFAGEIADKYKAKRITIIHRTESLVSYQYGSSFQKRLKSCLDSKSIELLLSMINAINYPTYQ
jgi:NADH dehydrogenase FAD-containing subunit